MSSWISRATENRNAQLVTTAVVSGVVVGSAILGFQKARRMYKVADLKASIPDIDDEHHATRVSSLLYHSINSEQDNFRRINPCIEHMLTKRPAD